MAERYRMPSRAGSLVESLTESLLAPPPPARPSLLDVVNPHTQVGGPNSPISMRQPVAEAPAPPFEAPRRPMMPPPTEPLAAAAYGTPTPSVPYNPSAAGPAPEMRPVSELNRPKGFFSKLASGATKILPYVVAGARGAGVGSQSTDPFEAFSKAYQFEQDMQRQQALLPFELEKARIENEKLYADLDKTQADIESVRTKTGLELPTFQSEQEKRQADALSARATAILREEQANTERALRGAKERQAEGAASATEATAVLRRAQATMQQELVAAGLPRAQAAAQAAQAISQAAQADYYAQRGAQTGFDSQTARIRANAYAAQVGQAARSANSTGSFVPLLNLQRQIQADYQRAVQGVREAQMFAPAGSDGGAAEMAEIEAAYGPLFDQIEQQIMNAAQGNPNAAWDAATQPQVQPGAAPAPRQAAPGGFQMDPNAILQRMNQY